MNITDKSGKLLHKIIYAAEVKDGRTDLSDEMQFLQVATLKHNKGKTFKAHQHNWNFNAQHRTIAQECWIVINGWVKVSYYDTKCNLLSENYLWPGDITITYEGGHNYMFMEDNSYVVEIKTGPYLGVDHDKTYIEL